jgi:hypothetical protein
MASKINIGNDLQDLLVTRNFDPKITNKFGQETTPNEGTAFSFDYIASSGKNYGTAVVVVGDNSELMLFFGDNLGRSMENPEDKNEWYDFMRQLKEFAVRHNFQTFTPKNINQIKHTMAGIAAIKEGLFEGYYGTKKVSYAGQPTEARLMIRHNQPLGEDDARYRNVESLFIETVDGERFKLPFRSLQGGRAMLEHVRQGGKPYDIRGCHIAEMVSEVAVLSRFNRASNQRMLEGTTQQLVTEAQAYYKKIKESLKHLSSARGYRNYFESWHPATIDEQESLVEDIKTLFVEQTIDSRIEAALPVLAKIQQGTAMKEADIFESWINNLAEGTWALPDTPDAKQKLADLLASELPVGADATNATEQLYDVFGDDQLFDALQELAKQNANADARPVIIDRMKEIGLEVPGMEPSNPGVTEADDISTFESDTEDAVAAFLSRGGEVQRGKYYKPRKSEKTDYGSRHIGGMRDAVAGKAGKTLGRSAATNFMGGGKAVVGEESGCNHTMEGEYCPEHGLIECGSYMESMGGTVAGAIASLEEGASDYVGDAIEGLRMIKPGMDRETFLDELYSYIDAKYGKRAADMALDHGDNATYDEFYANYSDLAEDSTDPMDHRGAVTDSFYESQLSRIKSLALLK